MELKPKILIGFKNLIIFLANTANKLFSFMFVFSEDLHWYAISCVYETQMHMNIIYAS